MHSARKLIAVFTVLVFSLTTFIPTFASASSDTEMDALTDFLTIAFTTGDAISELESFTQMDFEISTPETSLDTDWQNDARAFIEDFLNQVPDAYSDDADVSMAEARAISISYAIKCAKDSVDAGRGHDLAKEAEYMFLSHYVDRKDYFWNQGKVSCLLDGEVMSGDSSNGAFAIWITDSDRNAYNAYISSTKNSADLQRIGTLATIVYSMYGNLKSLYQFGNDITLIGKASRGVRSFLTLIDTKYTGKDIISDFQYIVNDVNARRSNDPTIKVSELFHQYMEEGNIFTDYSLTDYESMVRAALSIAAGCTLGGLAGAAAAAASTLVINSLTFTAKTFKDFFSYVAWLALQYSYSGRLALRASDAWGI